MTHPFHPLFGQELEFVKRRRNWRQDRVYVYDRAGELVSLPAEWTHVVVSDAFVVVAAGRSPFHVADLWSQPQDGSACPTAFLPEPLSRNAPNLGPGPGRFQ